MVARTGGYPRAGSSVERGHHFLTLATLRGRLDAQPAGGRLLYFAFGLVGFGLFNRFVIRDFFFLHRRFGQGRLVDGLAANLHDGQIASLGLDVVEVRARRGRLGVAAAGGHGAADARQPAPAARAGTPSTRAEARNTR